MLLAHDLFLLDIMSKKTEERKKQVKTGQKETNRQREELKLLQRRDWMVDKQSPQFKATARLLINGTPQRCLILLRGFSSLSFCRCLHCHSIKTGRKRHRSSSGHMHLRKKSCVS